MIPAFDIFEKEPSGALLWRLSASTLEEAKAHVRKLAGDSGVDYVIFNLRDGRKLTARLITQADEDRLETVDGL
jgi:hypothetical protein